MDTSDPQRNAAQVHVIDAAREPVREANVTLRPAGPAGKERAAIALPFDEQRGRFRAENVPPGRYILRVDVPGGSQEEREVTVGPAGLDESCIIAGPTPPFYYRGKVRVPFVPRPELLAVALRRDPRGSPDEEMRAEFIRLKLREEPISEAIRLDNVRVVRLPSGIGAQERGGIQLRLARHPRVERVGAVLHLDGDAVSFLTNELVVGFRASVTHAEVLGLAREHGLHAERALPYAGNAFVLRTEGPADYELLARCASLARSTLVEYAEPNLASSHVHDAVVPTDFLYAQQWHLPHIGLPAAWQVLRNANAVGVLPGAQGDLTFGSEHRVIAVMDSGIQSNTVAGVTSAVHPDFLGSVSSGAAKVYRFFDFSALVPHNDAPASNHGVRCAGVAAARAENPSAVVGEMEGVVGAAPNCRLMGLIYPNVEADYAEAYLWTAGFDVNSARAGFPAPISPGADVVTNSFGAFVGSPISAVMQACFDRLTSYGRDRRGVVLLFSAGNDNKNFVLERPWAAYPKTIAVAASTDADVKAWYSNFGNGIDVSAPSSNVTGITSTDLIPGGSLKGHTGGTLDYTDVFGGTSSATPLTAGVVALVLSANPKLTWVEVRHLLRTSTVMIDGGTVDPVGLWVDTDGNGILDYSQWYGYGRIDAAAAVLAARAYTHTERDLVIRNSLVDNGVNGLAVQPVESPDLWVRNDAVPVPAGSYATAPPHMVPEITVDPAIHIGIGHNDLGVSGTCTSAVEVTFTIEIDGIGPDTFKWNRDGVAIAAGVPVTGGVQLLSDGVAVTFAAAAGHTLGDRWIVKARQIVSRYVHLRIRNRGTLAYFPPDAPGIDVALSRVLLCMSDGFPVSRFTTQAPPGTDDLEVVSAYTGVNARAVYTVTIKVSDGNGDTFEWSRDGAPAGAAVLLTPGTLTQVLDDGVAVHFGSHTGHIQEDRWTLYARSGIAAYLNLDHYWDVDPGVAGEFDPGSGRAGTRALAHEGFSALPAGDVRTHSAAWGEAVRPPTNSPTAPKPTRALRIFALGEVLPHDGALNGFTVETNNNISYRELLFTKFRFTGDNGLSALDGALAVSPDGTVVVTPFRVEVRATAGSFAAERVRVRMKATSTGGVQDTRIFRWNGAAWSWVGGAPAWAVLAPPLEARRPDGTQPAAVGEQFDLQLNGTFTVNRTYAELLIETEILSDFREIAVASARHTVAVYEPMQSVGLATAAPPPPAHSHVFADIALLTAQTAEQAFGPVTDGADLDSRTTRFRATALFTASGDVNAYAVTDGFVAVQRNPLSADTVNLVLRPYRQPAPGFAPVRYFVYRGLRLTDFLHGPAVADETKVRAQVGAPAFVDQTWNTFLALNAGAVAMPSTVLGYDPATQLPGDSLDDLFFRVGSLTQLPFVSKGTVLGRFQHASNNEFGFEVMVEEGDYAPGLIHAMVASRELDVNGFSASAEDQFALRVRREEALNFLDPAAFYGLHMIDGGKVDRPNGSPWQGQDIYTNVISRFHTRNLLYVDVRSENGSSLNFQRNYDDGAGNQVQTGASSGFLVARSYDTDEWPLLIVDGSAPVATPADFNELHLKLPVDDNENPVLYVEHGQPLTAAETAFVGDTRILPSVAGQWTVTQGFEFPNTGASGARSGVASVLRLHYGRRRVPAPSVPVPATVLRTANYTDNVWGPIDRASHWAGSAGLKWITTQDNRYVDADLEQGWRQMMECGLATLTGAAPRVLLYAVTTDSDSNDAYPLVPARGVTDGVSDRASFFAEPGLFACYLLEHDQVADSGALVRTLVLRQRPTAGYRTDSALLLGLTRAEFDALTMLSAVGISADYHRTLVLDARMSAVDPTGRPFDRYRVGIQGLTAADGTFAQEFPASDIRVYSVDGQLFASPAFAAAEPLPTAYARNYEEAKGVLTRSARLRSIQGVNTATHALTLPGWDGRREVVAGDRIRIGGSAGNNGEYTVATVAMAGSDTVITLTAGPPGAAPSLGSVFTVPKAMEDWGIDLDRAAAIAGHDRMRLLVDGFVAGVSGVANDASAQAGLQAVVDLWAPRILGRARLRAAADRAGTEDVDRALYWARIRMLVALKGHPFCLASLSGRNALTASFETRSRGYDVDFAAAPAGARRVLLTGFDPFGLYLDPESTNPSAAIALALHGQTLNAGGNQAYVETAIFPVRYRDFDAGSVEALVNPRLAGPGQVDMIMSVSQNGRDAHYDVERFAGRRRAGYPDNEFVTQGAQQLGVDATHAAFYQTTLPVTAMVQGPFVSLPIQQVFFDESYRASSPDHVHEHFLEPGSNNPINSNTLSVLYPLPGRAVEGSGGAFLPNEIFYRIAHRREQLASTTVTGHVHVPATKYAGTGIETVILEVEDMIERWLATV